MSEVSGRALLLTNRKCRRGNEDLSRALEALRAGGLELIERHPTTVPQMGELIDAYQHEVDRVVLAGGDGTLNAAAQAVLRTGLPMGILPMGTANDLARTLGLPTDPVAAAEIICAGRPKTIDLGLVNGHCFFNAAHIGLGVAVTRRLSREAKGRWGVLSYGRTLMDAVRASRTFWAEVRWDGHVELLETIQIGVGNGRYYGGGMLIGEDAAVDDQLLNIYSLQAQSLWRLATLMPALRGGDYHRRGLWGASAREIEIHTQRPRSVVADGELVTYTPARFQVVPNALSVYTPVAEEEVEGVS